MKYASNTYYPGMFQPAKEGFTWRGGARPNSFHEPLSYSPLLLYKRSAIVPCVFLYIPLTVPSNSSLRTKLSKQTSCCHSVYPVVCWVLALSDCCSHNTRKDLKRQMKGFCRKMKCKMKKALPLLTND